LLRPICFRPVPILSKQGEQNGQFNISDGPRATALILGFVLIADGVLSVVIPFAFETGVLSLWESISVGRPLKGDEQWLIVIDMFLGCLAGPILGLLGVMFVGIRIGRMSRGPVENPRDLSNPYSPVLVLRQNDSPPSP
jgi:hypothetical protein